MDAGVTKQFLEAFKDSYKHIEHSAVIVFYYLAVIQLVLTALWMALKNNMPDFFAKMLQLFFTFGIFYGLVTLGGYWVPQVLNIFNGIGAQASSIQTLSPQSILIQGMHIALNVTSAGYNTGFFSGIVLGIEGFIFSFFVVIVYALIAADLAVVLIKSYALISLSSIAFAFGAQENVRPIAVNYFKAVIGIGLQLMTLYIILGVGVNLGQIWVNDIKAVNIHNLMPYYYMIGGLIIFYLVVKNVPPFIAGLSGIGGFQSYGDAAVGVAMSAAIQGAAAVRMGSKVTGMAGRATGTTASSMGSIGSSFKHGFSAAKNAGHNWSSAVGHGVSTAANHTVNAIRGVSAHKNTQAWNQMAGKLNPHGFQSKMREQRGENNDIFNNEGNALGGGK